MSGEHAKREMVTGEKLEAWGKKTRNELRRRRPVTNTRSIRKNPPAPSSHIGRVTRRKIK
jgi:hypothetical protein